MHRPHTSRALAATIALIAALHFALFGYFLLRTAITSPISDMFSYIAAYLRYRSGQVGLLEYLWLPHGEHRLLWIRLLTWADVEIFHTRSIAFIAAATAAICATAFLLLQQLRRALPNGTKVLALLAPMLILTSANVADCSIAINTTYPITVFFIVLALVLFASAQGRYADYHRTAALASAFAATLATSAGFLAWPILLFTAWTGRAGGRWLVILAASGVIYAALYVHNLPVHGLAPVLAMDAASFLSAQHVFKMLDYFFGFLGLPYTREPALGLIGRIIGAILLLAGVSAVFAAACSERMPRPLQQIATGMILLAIGAAALGTVGRSDLSEEVKLPVRYSIFVTGLHVGLLCLALTWLLRKRAQAHIYMLVNGVALALTMVLLVQQVFIGRAAARITDAIALEADCFARGTPIGPLSRVISPNPQFAETVIANLREHGLLAPRRCAPSPS
jgi:hypothetical protein